MKINLAPLLRLLQPSTNGNGLMAVAAGVYAILQVVLYHHPIGDPNVYISAAAAIAALYNRSQSTPVSDPRLSLPQSAIQAVHITTPSVTLTSTSSTKVQ